MDGNLTMSITYDGAHRDTQIAYVRDEDGNIVLTNTTFFDQWGNKTHTVQETFEPDDREEYDPWTMGTLVMVDGHLAIVVNEEDVEGSSFYNFDPETLTGKTKSEKELGKDLNGDGDMDDAVFKVGVDDDATQEELEALVGKEVNIMWQYYTTSDSEGTGDFGWIWLAPTEDWRVSWHLQNDNEASVEQWGGEWDRSKQYCVVGEEGEEGEAAPVVNVQSNNAAVRELEDMVNAPAVIMPEASSVAQDPFIPLLTLDNLVADQFVVDTLGYEPVQADVDYFLSLGCENMLDVYDVLKEDIIVR
jgi:hypothetical protein